jgi:lysophospholipase L1-like esterase
MSNNQSLHLLCLGDSYTIGEAVAEAESLPNITKAILADRNITVSRIQVIAKTGWTTDELNAAIDQENPANDFDFVTLLIGVNNQYRGRTLENYRQEFEALLLRSAAFAGGRKERVIVLSIPDWGITPFAEKDSRSAELIAAEIDSFNAVNKNIAIQHGCHYINITHYTREAKQRKDLLAEDGLHPSGKDYWRWATEVTSIILNVLK